MDFNRENGYGTNSIVEQAANLRKSFADEAAASIMLDKIAEQYKDLATAYQDKEKTNKILEEENKNLREANLKLLLKVGETYSTPEPDKTAEPEKRSFSNLIDEKGNLK